jgi:hypothetical protein
MLGVTLNQPLPYHILHGSCHVINVSRKPRRKITRQRIAIHASMKRIQDIPEDLDQSVIDYGAIVGTAFVQEIVRPERDMLLKYNKWATGPWCVVLSNRKACKPFRYRGKAGLWIVPKRFENPTSALRSVSVCECGSRLVKDVMRYNADLDRYVMCCTDCAGITAPLPGFTRVQEGAFR